MVIAVLLAYGAGISKFGFSCEDRYFWSIECWLFGYVMKVLDWASFITLATLMLYACYRVMERIGDLHWRRGLAERDLKAITYPYQR